MQTAEEAVPGVNLIVTATTTREPVIKRQWISPGAHINAVGTFSPKARELDTGTMGAASVFVDRRESELNEAGEYILAAAEGAMGRDQTRAGSGEGFIGGHPGRA